MRESDRVGIGGVAAVHRLQRGRSAALVFGLCCLAAAMPASAQQYTTYIAYADLGDELLAYETTYPTLCKRYDLGATVGNRRIWALRIGDTVSVEEDEPEVKYISSMHGDEIIGVPMCLNLIAHLMTNYNSVSNPDAQVDRIVNDVELWIVPLMNPDGYDRGSRTRYNNQGIDLNRNFPDPFTSPDNTPNGRAPETGVIMNWSFGRSFTLAANFHGGTQVVNYPYDNSASGVSTYTPSPDDDLFVWISEEYSRTNLPMWNGSFLHGITNGADWYAISGGMQDWSYRYMGCNEVTIELSINKQPPASSIATFWSENRQSMLNFIDTSLIGIRGVVTDAATGLPLAATIHVSGREQNVYTDPDVGDYHRMLLPGTYELSVEAGGLEKLTNPAIAVGSGDATRWDVALGSPTIVQYPNGGETLTVGVPAVLGWSGNAAAPFHIQYSPDAGTVTTSTDDFESRGIDPGYSTGGAAAWSLTTSDAHSLPTSLRSGAITDNEQSWVSRSVDGGTFGFWYRVSTEGGYDWFNFYLDGNLELHLAGNVEWTEYATVLAAGSHEVRWEYAKDGSVSSGSDAVWIDDVKYTSGGTSWFDVVPLTAPGDTEVAWTPPSEGAGYKIRVRAEYVDGSYGAWDESDAGFTVQAQPTEIPAVSDWGVAALALLVLTAGTVVLRRAAPPVPAGPVSVGERGHQDNGRKVKRAMNHGRMTLWAMGCVLVGSSSFAAEPAADLLAAASAGDVQRISELLDATPALIDVKDRFGNTPVHLAAGQLHVEVVDRLVKAGADLEGRNRDGMVPLHMVATTTSRPKDERSKREALTKLLLAAGADVQARDGQGLTPLHWAARKGRSGMLALLLKAKAGIEDQDRKGRMPLHFAALGNHKGVIAQLVDHGAVVNAVDKLGETPLHAAAHRFRAEATLALLKYGADVKATNKAGATALLVAAAQGPDEPEVELLVVNVVRVLLSAGADINAKDAAGFTALHYAVEKNRSLLANVLRARGARE